MLDGSTPGEKIDLGRIEGLTMNNFNKKKSTIGGGSSLMLP